MDGEWTTQGRQLSPTERKRERNLDWRPFLISEGNWNVSDNQWRPLASAPLYNEAAIETNLIIRTPLSWLSIRADDE